MLQLADVCPCRWWLTWTTGTTGRSASTSGASDSPPDISLARRQRQEICRVRGCGGGWVGGLCWRGAKVKPGAFQTTMTSSPWSFTSWWWNTRQRRTTWTGPRSSPASVSSSRPKVRSKPSLNKNLCLSLKCLQSAPEKLFFKTICSWNRQKNLSSSCYKQSDFFGIKGRLCFINLE